MSDDWEDLLRKQGRTAPKGEPEPETIQNTTLRTGGEPIDPENRLPNDMIALLKIQIALLESINEALGKTNDTLGKTKAAVRLGNSLSARRLF